MFVKSDYKYFRITFNRWRRNLITVSPIGPSKMGLNSRITFNLNVANYESPRRDAILLDDKELNSITNSHRVSH